MANNKKHLEITESKALVIHDVSKSFYCCKVENKEPKCKKQCQFCIDWVNEANEQ